MLSEIRRCQLLCSKGPKKWGQKEEAGHWNPDAKPQPIILEQYEAPWGFMLSIPQQRAGPIAMRKISSKANRMLVHDLVKSWSLRLEQ